MRSMQRENMLGLRDSVVPRMPGLQGAHPMDVETDRFDLPASWRDPVQRLDRDHFVLVARLHDYFFPPPGAELEVLKCFL